MKKGNYEFTQFIEEMDEGQKCGATQFYAQLPMDPWQKTLDDLEAILATEDPQAIGLAAESQLKLLKDLRAAFLVIKQAQRQDITRNQGSTLADLF